MFHIWTVLDSFFSLYIEGKNLSGPKLSNSNASGAQNGTSAISQWLPIVQLPSLSLLLLNTIQQLDLEKVPVEKNYRKEKILNDRFNLKFILKDQQKFTLLRHNLLMGPILKNEG